MNTIEHAGLELTKNCYDKVKQEGSIVLVRLTGFGDKTKGMTGHISQSFLTNEEAHKHVNALITLRWGR